MAVYVDTSAYVKLVVEEPGSVALRTWLADRDDPLVSSELLRVEALRAARRHSSEAAVEARSRLDLLTLVAVTTVICQRAADLDPAVLRSLDAVHIATALYVGDEVETVLTYDERFAAAARMHGLRATAPI